MIKIFFALFPQADYRDALWRKLDGLRKAIPDRVRWVSPENYHVTMKYIGPVDDETLAMVIAKTQEVVKDLLAPQVLLQHALLFPNPDKPRGIAALVKPTRELQFIFDAIETVLGTEGIKNSKHNFLPHLSIARVRNFNGPAFEPYELEMPEIVVPELTLLQSISTDHGVVYEPVEKILLKFQDQY